MGGVAGGALAAAVADAGGAGLVGVSYGNADFISNELPKAAASSGVWGAGLVMFTFDDNPALLDLVLAYRPRLVVLSFGDEEQTRRYVKAVHDENITVGVQIHDVTQAVAAADAGTDLIIAQGAEAGGHHNDRSTLPLIPAVVDALDRSVPVAAAGGIADGRGLAAAMALGADGVMIGTRFAAASEALTSPNFRAALLASSSGSLINTHVFDIVRSIPWPKQYTARSIANQFTDKWADAENDLAEHAESLIDEWTAAVAADDATQRALFAGENIDLITGIMPAADIITSLITDAGSILESLGPSSLAEPLPPEAISTTIGAA